VLALLLGALALLLLIGGLRLFERASVTSIKSLLTWIAALGGLVLTLLLILAGRGPIAFLALSLLLPLIRDRWLSRFSGGRAGGGSDNANGPDGGTKARSRAGTMSAAEAYAVLGVRAGASEAEIVAAHRRLIQAVHPDRGGSDWLAARLNQARDVLLRDKNRTGG
jgi:hypothetical protein